MLVAARWCEAKLSSSFMLPVQSECGVLCYIKVHGEKDT